MTLAEFRASLAAAAPPPGLPPALAALWRDAKGDWDGAHDLAQTDEGGAGDWVHAYLHRKEGDEGNAAYWYRRARKPVARAPLDDGMGGDRRGAAGGAAMTDEAAYTPLGEDGVPRQPADPGPLEPRAPARRAALGADRRAVERAAAPHGLTHIGRLTVNLLRPLPIGDCRIECRADHLGRGAGHSPAG